jgi:hypothetical protein
MPNTKPPYPAAFRQRMVDLVRARRGINELAREFGCKANTIHANVDEQKVTDALVIGRSLGRLGPTNQCQLFVAQTLRDSLLIKPPLPPALLAGAPEP